MADFSFPEIAALPSPTQPNAKNINKEMAGSVIFLFSFYRNYLNWRYKIRIFLPDKCKFIKILKINLFGFAEWREICMPGIPHYCQFPILRGWRCSFYWFYMNTNRGSFKSTSRCAHRLSEQVISISILISVFKSLSLSNYHPHIKLTGKIEGLDIKFSPSERNLLGKKIINKLVIMRFMTYELWKSSLSSKKLLLNSDLVICCAWYSKYFLIFTCCLSIFSTFLFQ